MSSLFRWLAIATMLMLCFYAKWATWWGGWSFSYRFLSELVPILTLATALAWERWVCRFILARWIFTLGMLVSIYFHFLGAFYYPLSEFNSTPAGVDERPPGYGMCKYGEIARDQKLLLADFKILATDSFRSA